VGDEGFPAVHGQFDQGPFGLLASGCFKLFPFHRPFTLNDVLQVDDRLDELFGTRRATRYVHIDGDEAIDPLHDGVGVENAARRGTGPHRDAPLGFVHLLPAPLEHGQHFHHDATGDNHQVALPRAEAKHLSAKAGQIVLAGAGRHELDAAASRGKGHRPEAVFAAPTGELVELGDDDVFGNFYRHWNTPFRQA